MIEIALLPNEIQYLILEYIRLENSYNFDIDSVYAYIEPYIFMIGGKLRINISAWFGTKNPEEYKVGTILHTINNRPYSIYLERSFGVFSRILYKNIKKFNIKNDVIDESRGKILFAGTYGPLQKGLASDYNIPFNKLSHVNFNHNVIDILAYAREIGINESELSNYSNTRKIIDLIRNKFLKEINESIIEFSKITGNYVTNIELKKIKGDQCDQFSYHKLFFNICKNKSNYQKLIELDILKKIK
jgi:hypothetical protein